LRANKFLDDGKTTHLFFTKRETIEGIYETLTINSVEFILEHWLVCFFNNHKKSHDLS